MKMVKSLLLGSAAGLVAVSAGQAADLPVKAKPVEYVKVCSLYGAGFYYMPGTDVCIKLGGFLRTEWNIHAGGSYSTFTGGSNAFQFRGEDNYVTRARGALTTDVREQTSYGTLRAYLAAGWQFSTDDPPTVSLPGNQATGTTTQAGGAITSTFTGASQNGNLYLLRAFIQLGGFTFGKTASFYDFFNTSKYSLQTNFINQDYGGFGVFTYGYTQTFGNGFAATIAAQDPSQFEHNIVDTTPTQSATATAPNVFLLNAPAANNNINAGTLVPDFVASLRVDQAWGGAQIAGIAHDNRATYYSNGTVPSTLIPNIVNGELRGSDHPDDKWGWAGMAGLELNLGGWGWFFSKGDSFAVQGQYCVGDSTACVNPSGQRFNDLSWSLVNVNKIGFGFLDDGYVANTLTDAARGRTNIGATGIQLSTNWNVFAGFQHYWMPDVRTSLWGGYTEFKANSEAVDVEVCQAINAGHFTAGGFNVPSVNIHGHVSDTGCADWAAWAAGSRTVWNPVKNLDVGVEALYTTMSKTAFSGALINLAPGGGAATQTSMTVADTHIWSGILRIQYNFLP